MSKKIIAWILIIWILLIGWILYKSNIFWKSSKFENCHWNIYCLEQNFQKLENYLDYDEFGWKNLDFVVGLWIDAKKEFDSYTLSQSSKNIDCNMIEDTLLKTECKYSLKVQEAWFSCQNESDELQPVIPERDTIFWNIQFIQWQYSKNFSPKKVCESIHKIVNIWSIQCSEYTSNDHCLKRKAFYHKDEDYCSNIEDIDYRKKCINSVQYKKWVNTISSLCNGNIECLKQLSSSIWVSHIELKYIENWCEWITDVEWLKLCLNIDSFLLAKKTDKATICDGKPCEQYFVEKKSYTYFKNISSIDNLSLNNSQICWTITNIDRKNTCNENVSSYLAKKYSSPYYCTDTDCLRDLSTEIPSDGWFCNTHTNKNEDFQRMCKAYSLTNKAIEEKDITICEGFWEEKNQTLTCVNDYTTSFKENKTVDIKQCDLLSDEETKKSCIFYLSSFKAVSNSDLSYCWINENCIENTIKEVDFNWNKNQCFYLKTLPETEDFNKLSLIEDCEDLITIWWKEITSLYQVKWLHDGKKYIEEFFIYLKNKDFSSPEQNEKNNFNVDECSIFANGEDSSSSVSNCIYEASQYLEDVSLCKDTQCIHNLIAKKKDTWNWYDDMIKNECPLSGSKYIQDEGEKNELQKKCRDELLNIKAKREWNISLCMDDFLCTDHFIDIFKDKEYSIESIHSYSLTDEQKTTLFMSSFLQEELDLDAPFDWFLQMTIDEVRIHPLFQELNNEQEKDLTDIFNLQDIDFLQKWCKQIKDDDTKANCLEETSEIKSLVYLDVSLCITESCITNVLSYIESATDIKKAEEQCKTIDPELEDKFFETNISMYCSDKVLKKKRIILSDASLCNNFDCIKKIFQWFSFPEDTKKAQVQCEILAEKYSWTDFKLENCLAIIEE